MQFAPRRAHHQLRAHYSDLRLYHHDIAQRMATPHHGLYGLKRATGAPGALACNVDSALGAFPSNWVS